jgi:adenosylcobinamide kinase/adenosylcobinamide-phosphate guanylyltransferase
MGIVPANELSRRFRDLAGFINQDVAAVSDTVVLMVCGLPLYVKGAAL